MKLRDLERYLAKHGAKRVAEGAKHTKWRSADGTRATTVPRHGEIGPGLVRAICRQLGHTEPVETRAWRIGARVRQCFGVIPDPKTRGGALESVARLG